MSLIAETTNASSAGFLYQARTQIKKPVAIAEYGHIIRRMIRNATYSVEPARKIEEPSIKDTNTLPMTETR